MKRKKNKPHKQTAIGSVLQIKTTVDFGEDGIPLERFGEITKLLKGRHLGAVPRVKPGFVPISFDRYVELHVQSNPSVDRVEFAHRLRQAGDARKAGGRSVGSSARLSLELNAALGGMALCGAPSIENAGNVGQVARMCCGRLQPPISDAREDAAGSAANRLVEDQRRVGVECQVRARAVSSLMTSGQSWRVVGSKSAPLGHTRV